MDPDILKIRQTIESRMQAMETEGELAASVELSCLLQIIDGMPGVKAGIRFAEEQANQAIDKMSLLDASGRMEEILAPEFHPSKGLLMRVFTLLYDRGYKLKLVSERSYFRAESVNPGAKIAVHGRIFTDSQGSQVLGLQIFNDYGTRTCFNGRLTKAEQIISILDTIA
jgi:hypothetical protein